MPGRAIFAHQRRQEVSPGWRAAAAGRTDGRTEGRLCVRCGSSRLPANLSAVQSSFSCGAGSRAAIGSGAPSHPALPPHPGLPPQRCCCASRLQRCRLQPPLAAPQMSLSLSVITASGSYSVFGTLFSPRAVLQPVCSLGAEPHRLCRQPGDAASRRVEQLEQVLDGG